MGSDAGPATDLPARPARHRPTGNPATPPWTPIGTWAVLKADFRANAPQLDGGAGRHARFAALLRTVPTVRFMAVLLLRLAQAAGGRSVLAGAVMKQLNHVLTGADLAHQARIGPGLVLYHPTGVVIGPDCRIGANARIMQGATIGSDEVTVGARDARSPSVGDDVFIGPNAVLFGGLRLGDRVTVGACSVVTSSFGDDVVVAGAPASVIRARHP